MLNLSCIFSILVSRLLICNSILFSRFWIIFTITVKVTMSTELESQSLKSLPAMWKTWVQSLGWEDPLEKEIATHSSILAWRIPWMKEPDGLQSMGSQRVGHNWATSLSLSFRILYQVDSLSLPLLFGLVDIYPIPLPAGFFSDFSSCLYCCVWGGLSSFWQFVEFSLLWSFLVVGGVGWVACQDFLVREACVGVLVSGAWFLLSGVQWSVH